jgi:hypothetical protein
LVLMVVLVVVADDLNVSRAAAAWEGVDCVVWQ